MSNLFPNSPILSLATNEKLQAVITPASVAGNKKKKAKAHRRQQRRKRGSKQDDTVIAMIGENKRVKLPKNKRRSEKANNYKALVKKMKKQTIDTADKKQKKKGKLTNKANKKQGKNSDAKNSGILPEERAYKRSLRLNRKDHALREESQVARKEVKMNLVETLNNMQKEATQKRKLAIIQGPLPEERAYRESIGHDPDAFLNPTGTSDFV